MISEAVEMRLAEAQRNRNRQDKRHPMLINIDDGRLMPNVPRLAGRVGSADRKEPAIPAHPKYRVYTGDLKATHAERMRWLATSGLRAPSVEDALPLEPFEIMKASREELVTFARENYPDVKLDPNGHLTALRHAVARAAGVDLA
jgi:hypothetical protein